MLFTAHLLFPLICCSPLAYALPPKPSSIDFEVNTSVQLDNSPSTNATSNTTTMKIPTTHAWEQIFESDDLYIRIITHQPASMRATVLCEDFVRTYFSSPAPLVNRLMMQNVRYYLFVERTPYAPTSISQHEAALAVGMVRRLFYNEEPSVVGFLVAKGDTGERSLLAGGVLNVRFHEHEEALLTPSQLIATNLNIHTSGPNSGSSHRNLTTNSFSPETA